MSLTQQLQTLESADLIRLAMARPELAYMFRHALVHEAAYTSLVRADRRRLHAMVGECLERLAGGVNASPEAAAALARHFDQAGDSRALPYALAAAEAAARRYANAEAVAHYDMVLVWARRDALTPTAQLADWHTARGRALELSGQYQAALETYRALGQLGTERGEEGLTLTALVLEGTLRATVNPLFNIPEAERLAGEGLALAQKRGDRAAEARIYWNQLNQLRFSGRFQEARASGEASLRLARDTGEDEQLARTLNDLAHVYGMSGLWTEHGRTVSEAAERWRALGNLPMLADSLATAALYASFRGDYATARRTSEEAGKIAHAIGNVWGQSYCLSGFAYVLLQRAEYAECLRASYECLRLAEEAGYMAPPVMNRTVLADALADLGQPEAALREARAALAFADGRVPRLRDIALGAVAIQLLATGSVADGMTLAQAADLDRMGETVWASEPIRRARVEAALAQRSPEALRLAEERLQPMRRQSMPPYIAEALEALARAQRQAGQLSAARASLEEARALCEQLGTRRTLWRVLLGLARVVEDADEAAAHEAAGRRLAQTIADELPEAAWREGFLRQVEVWERTTR
jgi:tetratricopeptide (TPR) repeat protein